MLGLSHLNVSNNIAINHALNTAIDTCIYSNNYRPNKHKSSSYREEAKKSSKNISNKVTRKPITTTKSYHHNSKSKPKYYDFFDTKFGGFDENGKIIWKN